MIGLGASVQQVDQTADLLKEILADPETYGKRVKELKKLVADLNKKMETSKVEDQRLDEKRKAAEKLLAEAQAASSAADAKHLELSQREHAAANRASELDGARSVHLQHVQAKNAALDERERSLDAREKVLKPKESRLAAQEKSLSELSTSLALRESKAKEYARTLMGA